MKYKGMLREKLIFLQIILIGTGLAASVHASDLIVPGLFVEQIFTDNVNLDTSGGESESITRITPRLSIYRKGARSYLDLSYAPQYRHYWQDTQSNELVHFLRADGDIALVKNHLFVDGWASADQHTINSSGRTGIDSATGTGDITQVYSGGISPYFTSRLGSALAFEARYGLNRVYYDAEDRDSSTGQRVDLVLGSGPAIKGTPWETRLEHYNIDYDDLDADDKIKRARAEMAYQFNYQWALAAVLGYEEYELAISEDQKGQIWNLGMIYSPNPRTNLIAGVGERFFGNDYFFDFSHRSRRTVWTASYRRDFTNARHEVIRPNLFKRKDAFGNLIRDPVLSEPVFTTSSGPTLSADYYLLESFETRFTLNSKRTTIILSARYAMREYEELSAPADTDDLTLAGRFSRQLRPRTTGFLHITWRDHQEELSDYEQWLASLGGKYQLGPHTDVQLSLAHLNREAVLDEDSYSENRVSLGLNRSW